MSFPARWSEPQFKGPRMTTKQRRAKTHRGRAAVEKAHMLAVRARDGRCRFPLCPCHRLGMKTEVSHLVHRGMGGDPSGDRSQTSGMVLVCHRRHQGTVSIDAKNLRWRALTDDGSDGPIVWDVKADAIADFPTLQGVEFVRMRAYPSEWYELAREHHIREWEPFTVEQQRILKALAKELTQ